MIKITSSISKSSKFVWVPRSDLNIRLALGIASRNKLISDDNGDRQSPSLRPSPNSWLFEVLTGLRSAEISSLPVLPLEYSGIYVLRYELVLSWNLGTLFVYFLVSANEMCTYFSGFPSAPNGIQEDNLPPTMSDMLWFSFSRSTACLSPTWHPRNTRGVLLPTPIWYQNLWFLLTNRFLNLNTLHRCRVDLQDLVFPRWWEKINWRSL